MYSHGVIYTYCGQVDDYTITVAVTLTQNPTLTIKKENRKCFDLNLYLNHI